MKKRKIAILVGWGWVVAATVLGPVAYSAMRDQFWFAALMTCLTGMLIIVFTFPPGNAGQSNRYTRLSTAVNYTALAVWVSPATQLTGWIPANWPSIDIELATYFAIVLFILSGLLHQVGSMAIPPNLQQTQTDPEAERPQGSI